MVNAIFWLVLLLYVIVGVVASKMVKTAADYYVMGNRGSTLLITGTLTATYASASTMMGIAGLVYTNGPPFFLLIYGSWFGILLGMLYTARRLRAMGAMTMPDYLEERYGSRVRIAGTIVMIVGLFAYGIIQIMGAGVLLADVVGLSYESMIVVFGITLLIFSVLGGMWGVVTTDTMMLVTMFIATLVVAPIAMVKAGGLAAITHILPAADPLYWSSGGAALKLPIGWSIGQWVLWAVFFISAPWIVSRAFPAKNDFTVMKSTILSTLLATIMVTVFFLGIFGVRVLNPDIVPADRVFVWTSQNLVHPLIGGLGIAGVMGAILSTASTIFIYTGFALSRDLFERISPKQYSDSQKIVIARICQLIVGVALIAITLARPLSIYWIAAWSGGLFATAWGPVMVASFEWKRVTEKAALAGMIFGPIFYVTLYSLSQNKVVALPFTLDPVIFGIIFSSILIVIVSLLTKQSDIEFAAAERMSGISLSSRTVNSFKDHASFVKEYNDTYKIAIGASVVAILVFGYYIIKIVPFV